VLPSYSLCSLYQVIYSALDLKCGEYRLYLYNLRHYYNVFNYILFSLILRQHSLLLDNQVYYFGTRLDRFNAGVALYHISIRVINEDLSFPKNLL
jgi:hypothetical protein